MNVNIDSLLKKSDSAISEILNKALSDKEVSAEEGLRLYKENTPKDGGNARRNTKRVGRTIIGDYPYAGVLDDGLYPNPPVNGTGKTTNGYSTQATKGMSEPTIAELTKQFNRFVKRV